jgi:hypothetical protein
MERFLVQPAINLRVGQEELVGQLSAMICNIPDSSNSLIDCIARIIVALRFGHVFCA